MIPLAYAFAAVLAAWRFRAGASPAPARAVALLAFAGDLALLPKPPAGREMAALLVGLLVVAELYLALRLGRSSLSPFVLLLAAALRLAAGAAPEPFRLAIHPAGNLAIALHVGLVLAGYASCFVAALAGGLYLLAERELRARRPSDLGEHLPPLEETGALQRRAVRLAFVLYSWGVAIGAIAVARIENPERILSDPMVRAAGIFWVYLSAQFILQTAWGFRRRRAAAASVAGGIVVFLLFLGLAWGSAIHP